MGFWLDIVHPINKFLENSPLLGRDKNTYGKLLIRSFFCTMLIIMGNFTLIFAQIQPNNILLNKNIAKDTFSNPTILADTAQNRSIDYKLQRNY